MEDEEVIYLKNLEGKLSSGLMLRFISMDSKPGTFVQFPMGITSLFNQYITAKITDESIMLSSTLKHSKLMFWTQTLT